MVRIPKRCGNGCTLQSFSCSMSLRLDALSLVFVFIITFVGSLIHIYSIAFMQQDRDYARFFACMNLFVCAMLILVMADNLVLLYLGWEGVGLCSYLLIGFWYETPANCHAANKAFYVTRIGDTAMAIGLFLLFKELGTLNIPDHPESIAFSLYHRFIQHYTYCINASDGWHGQIGPVAPANMVARCYGGPFTGECPDTCSYNGNCRCVPYCKNACGVPVITGSHGYYGNCGSSYFICCWVQRHGADRYQKNTRLFHHQPDWLYVPGIGNRRMECGHFSFLHACLFQSIIISCCGGSN